MHNQTTSTAPRYIVANTNILDQQTGLVAKFQNQGVAQIGADWLNSPDAEPESYEWTCPHAWCEVDHTDPELHDFHETEFERGRIRFVFYLSPNGPAMNWTDSFAENFTPDNIDTLNTLAADIIVGKAAFEQFVEEVSK